MTKTAFTIICIITSSITLFTVALKYDLYFSYMENISSIPQNYIITNFVSNSNIYLFLALWLIGTVNITFRAFINWSRVVVGSIITHRFEYLEIIKEKTISVFPTWKTIIEFTFHRTSNRIFNQQTVIRNVEPKTSVWMKVGVLTGAGVFGASVYTAGESHFTRIASEKSADAAEKAADAAQKSANAAQKAADVSAVQAKLMTEEEFHKRYPKNS